eukprot:Hpha_TRINITY_DN5521_c0_g1::TRINITY_DN5521_c0_g1_i1::g.93751::m.93751
MADALPPPLRRLLSRAGCAGDPEACATAARAGAGDAAEAYRRLEGGDDARVVWEDLRCRLDPSGGALIPLVTGALQVRPAEGRRRRPPTRKITGSVPLAVVDTGRHHCMTDANGCEWRVGLSPSGQGVSIAWGRQRAEVRQVLWDSHDTVVFPEVGAGFTPSAKDMPHSLGVLRCIAEAAGCGTVSGFPKAVEVEREELQPGHVPPVQVYAEALARGDPLGLGTARAEELVADAVALHSASATSAAEVQRVLLSRYDPPSGGRPAGWRQLISM